MAKKERKEAFRGPGLPCSCDKNDSCPKGYVCRKYVPPGENPADIPGQCIRREKPSQIPCDAHNPSSCPKDQTCIWSGWGEPGTCQWNYSC
ncbi:MAG TPA: hypothetical protein PKD85_22215 [Saprospiraceae bacterium]|nr:hypothetical protein [Saprospiraceae bacterium]